MTAQVADLGAPFFVNVTAVPLTVGVKPLVSCSAFWIPVSRLIGIAERKRDRLTVHVHRRRRGAAREILRMRECRGALQTAGKCVDRGDARLAVELREARDREGRENAEDRDHHDQFDEGEAGLSIAHGSSVHYE